MRIIAIFMILLGIGTINESMNKLKVSDYYNNFYVRLGKQTLFIRSEESFLFKVVYFFDYNSIHFIYSRH